MKRMKFVLLVAGIWTAVFAEGPVMRMESDPSQQFLLQINSMLVDVSPEYAENREAFQESMTAILREAHNLELKWSRVDKKGKEPAFTKEQIDRDGGVLIDKALDETEKHVQYMLDTLKKKRVEIRQKLLDQGKQAE